MPLLAVLSQALASHGGRHGAVRQTFINECLPLAVYLLDQKLDRDKIQNIIRTIFETSECGKIFRIKGFVQENGQWYEVNGTRHETKIDAIGAGQDVAIVIGEKLDEGKIQSIFAEK